MLVPLREKLELETVATIFQKQQKRYAPALGYFLTPVSLAGYVLAVWRLGADLKFVDEFFVSSGLFSRWQVWLAVGIATQLAARELNRVGQSGDTAKS